MDIEFPIDFFVVGVPVSLQGSPHGKRAWQAEVELSARHVLPDFHFASAQKLFVTIAYFTSDRLIADLDNIVKPILDALSGVMYIDDSQIERLLIQKYELGRVGSFANPSNALISALSHPEPALYVRLTDKIPEDL